MHFRPFPLRALVPLWALLALAVHAQTPGPRFALVIGNSDYRHAERLPNTGNDAEDIAGALAALGYEVDLRLNSDLPAMTRAIGGWVRRLSADRNSEGFFWYAGHGIQAGGENYLLPVDIEAEDEAAIVYGSYPLGRLLLSLEQTAKNKLNLVILDACRDNPFKNLSGGSRGLSRGFVTVEHPPQDIFIMFSTAPGAVAQDGTGSRNSPFTEAFLRYIDSAEILPVMAGLVTRETMRLTGGRQRPYQNGSIVSELYYTLGPARRTPADQASAPLAAAGTARAAAELPTELPHEDPWENPAMAAIPGGTFAMGSDGMEPDRAPFQEFRHQVKISPFLLGVRELTVGEFRRFVEETGYRTAAEEAGGAFAYNEGTGQWDFRPDTDWRRPGFAQDGDHPAVNLSWLDAVRYCNWLSGKEGLQAAYTISGEDVRWDRSAPGYRLPTEAEWEYACRAGTDTPFFTGQRLSTAQANYNGNFPYNNGNRGLFRKGTTAAASFPANPWGLYDMHGNVWEWCWDSYGLYYKAGEEPALVTDPAGPSPDGPSPDGPDSAEPGALRINRGGGWASPAKFLRSAARSADYPETAGGSLGFRLARNN
ncbi:MAG: SUMF1/EgtB/PvdO family nonheme iron enzyme [Treponema sp.]|jgi:formylglycine-generating enzyme required for sulfatase activity|nr:SUMF1/EgtB/PvdO family nonheme iron enzyme [Treponema sp.]